MKYVARVKEVLASGIHMNGALENGRVRQASELPRPDRVEIEIDGTEAEPCMMYRYADDGSFCGDTWHQTFELALRQAAYEYGLARHDFQSIEES